MIKLDDFSLAIKVVWLRRYAILKTNDHWADIIDTHLGLTTDTRTEIFKFGPERFNKIIKLKLPAISGIMAAFKVFTQNIPNTIESNDNSWLHQPIFYNNNFTRKYPGKCKQSTYLTPTFYGLEDQHHTLSVMDFYEAMAFKTVDQIELTTGTKLSTIQYASLKGHITSHIGHHKKYDGLVKETTPQKKYTFSNTKDFLNNNKKGSGTIKKIINRKNKRGDICNIKRWNDKLGIETVTEPQVRESLKRLNSKYIDSHNADHLSRLKLGKKS